MKIATLLLFTTFFLCKHSYCQLEKGTWLINGTGNFSSSNYNFKNTPLNTSQKSTSLNIKLTPSVAFFVIDKLAVGVKPSISFEKAEGGDLYDSNGNIIASGGSSKITRFDVGPFIRYYFLEKEKTVNVFTESGYQYGINKGFGFAVQRDIFFINIGTEIFFTSSVGLEFTLGYLSKKEKNGTLSTQTQNTIQAGIGFNFHLQN